MTQKRKYKINEAAEECGVTETVIIQFIQNEWILPIEREELELDDEDVARARLIRELQQDLGANDEAVPIILHLIDQIHHLHLKLRKSSQEGGL